MRGPARAHSRAARASLQSMSWRGSKDPDFHVKQRINGLNLEPTIARLEEVSGTMEILKNDEKEREMRLQMKQVNALSLDLTNSTNANYKMEKAERKEIRNKMKKTEKEKQSELMALHLAMKAARAKASEKGDLQAKRVKDDSDDKDENAEKDEKIAEGGAAQQLPYALSVRGHLGLHFMQ